MPMIVMMVIDVYSDNDYSDDDWLIDWLIDR